MRVARLVVLVLMLVGAREAAAECGDGGTSTTQPPSGSVLPANPTLYVFLFRRIEAPIRVTDLHGRRVAADIDWVGASHAYDVFAVRPRISRGGLRVQYEPEREPAFFDVSPSLAVAPTLSVQGAPSYTYDRWTCSHTDAVAVPLLSNAIAHRVEWEQDGATKVAYLPRDMRDLYNSDYYEGGHLQWVRSAAQVRARHKNEAWRTEPSLQSTITLGHISCFGATVPDDAFRVPTVVRVIGLYADGTEVDGGLVGAHRLGELAQKPQTWFSIEEAPDPPLFDDEIIFQAADAQRLRRMRLAALAVAGALVVVVVGFVRRRRRAAVW